MFRSRWLRNLLDVARSDKDLLRPTTRSRKSICLMLEPLEDRTTPSGFQTLYSFTGGSDGKNPQGGVILDSSGNLYGTTALGGLGRGTLFDVSSKGVCTTLYSFTAAGGNNPLDAPIRDSNGNLYGTTNTGGTNLDGTVFEYGANGTYSTLHTFAAGTDGEKPIAGLIVDKQGDLFGTTSFDSANGGGSVFELSPNGSGGYNFSTLYSFNAGQIYSGVVMDSAGNLYGTTLTGGTSGVGEVYKLSPNGSGGYTYSTLHNFTGQSDGGNPIGGLILDGSGNLYGTTYGVGAGSGGTVFKVSTDGSSFTTLYSFDANGNRGANPEDDLFMDSKGNLYATTYQGGASNDGVVFELSPNESGGYTYSTLHTFVGSDGANPYAGLVTDGNGNLYGTTINGGSNNDGTLFELTSALPASTTTTASSVSATFSPNAQNVTLTANVTSNSAAVNEGTVTFTILQNRQVIGAATTANTVSNGQASVSYALPAGLTAGAYTIDAVYNPGLDFAGSSDNTHTVTVKPANVTTTANNATIVLPKQQTVMLSAAVADSSDSSNTMNEGAVTFTVKDSKGNIVGSTVQGTVSSGTAKATYTLPSGQAPGNYSISVSYSDSAGNFTGSGDTKATLTVLLVPTVTTNPSDRTVTAGQNATFTAAANGNPTATVQWQASSDGGATWTTISGATSTTLTLTNVTTAMNGDEYEAVFTNSLGSVTTSTATLTVQFAPAVTVNPTNQTVTAGNTATFTAAASGNPTATVQWQVSTDGGATWTNIGGATGTTLALNNTLFSQNGDKYRAVFSNSLGVAPTIAASLTVQTPPVITIGTSGTSSTFTIGQGGSFTVTVTGSPTPTLSESGALPDGITFIDNGNGTATLNGTPAAGTQGTYLFTITAHNAAGSITQNFTLTIDPAPLPPPSPPVPTPTPIPLSVPPLLALFDSLLGGTETINADGTETITDSLFGISLLVATYDSSGNLLSATLLGFNVPNWVWSL